MIYQVIYVSTSVEPMSSGNLTELLTQCRENNERNRITGMLLHKQNHFMQAVEGEESAVRGLVDKIKNDSRHKNIDFLREYYRPSRDFPNWTMGFCYTNLYSRIE